MFSEPEPQGNNRDLSNRDTIGLVNLMIELSVDC